MSFDDCLELPLLATPANPAPAAAPLATPAAVLPEEPDLAFDLVACGPVVFSQTQQKHHLDYKLICFLDGFDWVRI